MKPYSIKMKNEDVIRPSTYINFPLKEKNVCL